jgi:DNA-binding NtrC family response regulator
MLVDPDEDFLKWADKHLRTPDTDIICKTDSSEALELYLQAPSDLVISELYTQPLGGMELLRKIRLNNPNSMVVLTTGFPPTSSVIEAMKLGAYDVLRKESLPYDLRPVVEEALKAGDIISSTPTHDPQSLNREHPRETIIGNSPAMQEVFKMIGRAARGDAPVLITGESGSGKEVVAGGIHSFSRRSGSEHVTINCAAIPENLLESELFGHEKGAFTGATSLRKGRFEQCDGGTLFLDEIGDMPLQTQGKILRVLQSGEFSRVGGNDAMRADVRILAATNKDLEKAVEEGTFREDLFYRLNVVRIHIPPLRNRREDIRPLADFFLNRIAEQKRGPKLRLADDTFNLLESYNWPGNVRELENTINRASILATADVLLPKDIPLDPAAIAPDPGEVLSESKITELLHLLSSAAGEAPLLPWLQEHAARMVFAATDNDKKAAASRLGITQEHLKELLRD